MVAGPGLGFLALVPLAALASGAAPAGEPIPIRVEFDAPAGCSSADAFYAGVMARSDRARRAGAGEEGVRLGVRITRVGGKVHGELRVLDGRADLETRKVEGGRCDEVVEVLSLTAALAIDPGARVASVPATSAAAPAAATTPTTAGAPPVTAPAQPAPQPGRPPSPATPPAGPGAVATATETKAPGAVSARAPLALSFGVGARTAETVSPSFGGAVSVRLEKTTPAGRGPSLALAGVYVDNELFAPAAELASTFTALELSACPGWSAGTTLVVEPCAQAIGGWLTATDRAVTNPHAVGRTWGSLGAMVRAALRVGAGFALELEAGLAVPVVARRFITTTPEQPVGQTHAISGAIGLGITFTP